MVLIEQSLTWSAPIPPPEIIGGYNDVIKDGAERVFRQFEIEAEHRRDMQRTGQRYSFIVALSGRVSALIFSLAFLGVAVLALYWNQPLVAAVFGGGTVALVVTAFTSWPSAIKQRGQQSKPTKEK